LAASAERWFGTQLTRQISGHHRRRLRRIGWGQALDPPPGGWAATHPSPRPGNAVEVLIDGTQALPAIAEELRQARSHIHLTAGTSPPALRSFATAARLWFAINTFGSPHERQHERKRTLQGSRSISPLGTARGGGDSLVRSTAFEMLSRAGFVARALVYAIIGVLALEVATGVGGRLTNQQGALQTVANETFGKALLTVLAVGLGGYAAWRLLRAALGHGPEASDNSFERVRRRRERDRLCVDVRGRGRDPLRSPPGS
jgi:hypothetical protein